ncbi:MAG: hypothetical protein C0483_18085 [Pirellula sp.]|nr:hypothetical protein [Pirellula sp.]
MRAGSVPSILPAGQYGSPTRVFAVATPSQRRLSSFAGSATVLPGFRFARRSLVLFVDQEMTETIR